MFLPEKDLKKIIISSLKKEEKSISGLYRMLENEGYKLHRLTLTGYLKALSDVGILKEKEIPPSKVYTTSGHYEKNIYEAVSEKCKAIEKDEKEQVRIAIYVLQKLFHRAIFLEEIKQCELKGGVDAELATDEQRMEAKKLLQKAGYRIPRNDPVYKIKEKYEEEYNTIIMNLFLEKFSAQPLVLETKQLKLIGKE